MIFSQSQQGGAWLLCPHPERGLQLDLAVGPGALQREALVHAHVGGVEEASERQVEDAQLTLLLVLFHLQPEETEPATTITFSSCCVFYELVKDVSR